MSELEQIEKELADLSAEGEGDYIHINKHVAASFIAERERAAKIQEARDRILAIDDTLKQLRQLLPLIEALDTEGRFWTQRLATLTKDSINKEKD